MVGIISDFFVVDILFLVTCNTLTVEVYGAIGVHTDAVDRALLVCNLEYSFSHRVVIQMFSE